MDSPFKRHFALAETHPQQRSDKKHYVNYRDLHVNLPKTITIPPIPRALASKACLSNSKGGFVREPLPHVALAGVRTREPTYAVALPAVVCTSDKAMLDLARRSGSVDGNLVKSPVELVAWLATGADARAV